MYSRTRSEPPDFTVSTVHRVCSKAGLVTAPLSGEVEGLDADTPAVLLHSYQVDLAVVTDAPALMPTFRLMGPPSQCSRFGVCECCTADLAIQRSLIAIM
jgi:hypothetical protein